MSSTANLKKFAASLRELPLVVGHRVAKAAAPILTSLVLETFRAGEDPYGAAWAPGVDGRAITLRKSGALEAALTLVAIGSRIRLAALPKHAKWLIGKRPVSPRQGEPMPPSFSAGIASTVPGVIREALR